jgi:hypothetical protein
MSDSTSIGISWSWHSPRGFGDTWRLVHHSGRIVERVRKTLDGEYETGGVFYATLESAKAAAAGKVMPCKPFDTISVSDYVASLPKDDQRLIAETRPRVREFFDTTSPCGDPDVTVMARDAETGEPTMFLRRRT